jgi:hypothetical protein
MTYDLTNDEKKEIIGSSLKRLSNHKFNIELLMIEESSVSNPKESIITDLQNQINDCSLRIEALSIKLNEID